MITTDRNQFIAGHVTKKVKKILGEEARKRQMSVSALIYKILIQGLKKMGHKEELNNE